MNPEALKIFNYICQKDAHELTDFEVAFLRARNQYLNKEQREKFSCFFEPSLKELQQIAKSKGIKGAHLYKDPVKLAKIINT